MSTTPASNLAVYTPTVAFALEYLESYKFKHKKVYVYDGFDKSPYPWGFVKVGGAFIGEGDKRGLYLYSSLDDNLRIFPRMIPAVNDLIVELSQIRGDAQLGFFRRVNGTDVFLPVTWRLSKGFLGSYLECIPDNRQVGYRQFGLLK